MLQLLKERALGPATAVRVLVESGVVRPYSPAALAGIVRSLNQWGMGIAGGFSRRRPASPTGSE